MSNDKEDDIAVVYSAVQGFSNNLMFKIGTDPLVVAAVLASTALSIYKTALPPKDFEDIVDAIAASKDSVKPLVEQTDPTIH